MSVIRPKGWAEFQHYKDRSPAWIKLHRRLLDDYEFHCLPVASRALAPMLWLLASEYDDGDIPGNTRTIAFRLRMTLQELSDAFEPLKLAGFFAVILNASETLVEAERVASPEKENKLQETSKTQVTTKTEARARRAQSRATKLPDKFPLPENLEAAEAYWLKKGREDLCGRTADIAEAFRDHHTANGTTSLDWDASWRTWYRNSLKFEKVNGHGHQRESSHQQLARVSAELIAEIEREREGNPGPSQCSEPAIPEASDERRAISGVGTPIRGRPERLQ